MDIFNYKIRDKLVKINYGKQLPDKRCKINKVHLRICFIILIFTFYNSYSMLIMVLVFIFPHVIDIVINLFLHIYD